MASTQGNQEIPSIFFAHGRFNKEIIELVFFTLIIRNKNLVVLLTDKGDQ